MSESYWIETLGRPKMRLIAKTRRNLLKNGMTLANSPESADLVVYTCAFIEDARKESVDTIYQLNSVRNPDSELVVTGCLAERYGPSLEEALGDDVNSVAGFESPSLYQESKTLQNLIYSIFLSSSSNRPWGYVKVAEGCDEFVDFVHPPRGPQRSRSVNAILAEIESMELSEVVLIAQDLASYGRDLNKTANMQQLYEEVSKVVEGSGCSIYILKLKRKFNRSNRV